MKKHPKYLLYVLLVCVAAVLLNGCGSGTESGNDDTPEAPSYTTVTGTVLDYNGDRIKGAEVTIQSDLQTAMTDDDGFFKVTVETGNHTISIKVKSDEVYSGNFTCYPDEHMSLNDIKTDHNKIYKSTDYFPLNAGDSWSYTDRTANVMSETHTFNKGTGRRVNNLGQGCDDKDLFMAQSEDGLVIYGYHDGEYKEFDMDDPFVFLPAEMEKGRTWSIETNEGWSATLQFVGTEDVNVNAGFFEKSLKIEVDVSGNDGSYSTSFWFAENVGIVKALRTEESLLGHDGCWMVTSDNPLIELESAVIDGYEYGGAIAH